MTENNNSEKPIKNWLTTLILCWFLGFLGVHRMYAGKLTSGFYMAYGTIFSACVLVVNIYLGAACFTLMAAWVLTDFFAIATKKFRDCYGRDIVSDKLGE
jgi:TM2 domain-containing membrane protein YozV